MQLVEDKIKIERIEAKGKNYIDVRKVFYNDADELCYTKKGVWIPEDYAKEVAAAILAALKEKPVEVNL